MATTEERLRILKMVQDGKITAEDGIQLLEVLDGSPNRGGKASSTDGPAATTTYTKGGARWLRVRVTDTDSGKTRVNVRLPIGVVTAGMKMGARFSTEVEGLDVNQLNGFIRSGIVGQIVDVYDDQDGEHVEVFLE